MTYLDRTFCVSKNCKNACGRKMTEQEKKVLATIEWEQVSYANFCEKEENFLAVGQDELGGTKKGDLVSFNGTVGKIQYGIMADGKETNLLGYVDSKDGKSYLVAIKDKLLRGATKI